MNMSQLLVLLEDVAKLNNAGEFPVCISDFVGKYSVKYHIAAAIFPAALAIYPRFRVTQIGLEFLGNPTQEKFNEIKNLSKHIIKREMNLCQDDYDTEKTISNGMREYEVVSCISKSENIDASRTFVEAPTPELGAREYLKNPLCSDLSKFMIGIRPRTPESTWAYFRVNRICRLLAVK